MYKIYALNDSKIGDFGLPFFFQTSGQAVRFLADLVRDSKTVICQHPEDFRLYELGTYDNHTGTFTNLAAPDFIAKAADFTESETANVRKIG